jgi:hypothetical protein
MIVKKNSQRYKQKVLPLEMLEQIFSASPGATSGKPLPLIALATSTPITLLQDDTVFRKTSARHASERHTSPPLAGGTGCINGVGIVGFFIAQCLCAQSALRLVPAPLCRQPARPAYPGGAGHAAAASHNSRRRTAAMPHPTSSTLDQ